MPLIIPPFVQYQAPMFPLRGLTRHRPAEGDYLITCEIDWLVSPPGAAVQFSVSGNSPVALSQIVTLAVDNSLSGADVQFIFTDSGFKLTVPARNQVIAPVMTNGLTFIAASSAALIGDTTIFQIFNYEVPPVSIAPTRAQNLASATGVPVANGSTALIPAGVNGTLAAASISLSGAPANEALDVALIDGTGKTLWLGTFSAAGSIDPGGLSVRFQNGVNVVVSSSTMTAGAIVASAYYSTP